jgi:hypothetical protein
LFKRKVDIITTATIIASTKTNQEKTMTIEELEERQRKLEEELDEVSSKLYQARIAEQDKIKLANKK